LCCSVFIEYIVVFGTYQSVFQLSVAEPSATPDLARMAMELQSATPAAELSRIVEACVMLSRGEPA
jgi:hypothetical protein